LIRTTAQIASTVAVFPRCVPEPLRPEQQVHQLDNLIEKRQGQGPAFQGRQPVCSLMLQPLFRFQLVDALRWSSQSGIILLERQRPDRL